MAEQEPEMDKAALRRLLIERRRALPEPRRRQASAAIVRHVADFALARTSSASAGPSLSHVGLFLPFRGEPDLTGLAPSLTGVRFALPVVSPEGRGMSFYEWTPGAPLLANRYGILEPDPRSAAAFEPHGRTLLLVPAVAVDLEGGRLGYGGGYYDRYLGALGPDAPLAMAVVYADFLVPRLPLESHDQRLSWVVTEHGVRCLTKKTRSVRLC